MPDPRFNPLRHLEAAASSMADAILTIDAEGRIVYASPAVRDLFGYEPEELMGGPLTVIIPEDLRQRHANGLARYLATGRRNLDWSAIELPVRHRDGSIYPAEIAFGEYVAGERRYFTGVIRDISMRKRQTESLEVSARAYRQLFEHNVAGVYRVSLDGAIRDVNAAMALMLGYDREQLLHLSAADVYPDPRDREDWVRQVVEKGSLTNTVLRLRHRDGRTIWTLENATLVDDPETGEPSIVGTAIDITERKRLEEDLVRMAFRDPLTGLANRRLLQEMTTKAILRAVREEGRVAMVCLDLVRFKRINDAFGHSVGDRVLTELAERLRSRVRASDTVARVGGDEFAVLLVNVPRIEDGVAAARGLKECLTTPFLVAGEAFHLDGRIGVAFCPEHGERFDELLSLADLAMYQSVTEESGIALYKPVSRTTLREALWLEEQLRGSLQRQELELHYQPICRLPDRAPVAWEALLRWHHPERGLLEANEFIAIAEQSGMLRRLDRWVIRAAARQSRAWQGHPDVQWVSVNVSPATLEDPQLSTFVESVLAEEGIHGEGLAIEITERATTRDPEGAVRTLRRLRDLGLKILIDDFGRGHSALAYLVDFPADYLKVDKCFVTRLGHDESQERLVEGLIGLCRGLEIPLIAEGVDHPDSLAWLESRGCGLAQGNHLGPPVAAPALTRSRESATTGD
ncbi:MAG TPA: EAL domain-containing protein [Gemmatimonadota bacterium]|nr:EAL domain-containing protein [Gemmatimonadota bacterium]